MNGEKCFQFNSDYLSETNHLCGMTYVTNGVTSQPNKGITMKATTNNDVDTRPSAGAEAVTTNLTIDWADMTTEDVQALAQQALIVKLQGKWRKDGIPNGEHTVKAADYKVGVRAPRQPTDVLALIGKMTPEEKAALLAKLSA
jgi:hypothetical protein